MDYIMQTLFTEPFKNKEVGRYLLYRLSRGVAGLHRDKKMLLCLGRTNSGKGTLCGLRSQSLGSCTGSFLANSLLSRKKDSLESAKARSELGAPYSQ